MLKTDLLECYKYVAVAVVVHKREFPESVLEGYVGVLVSPKEEMPLCPLVIFAIEHILGKQIAVSVVIIRLVPFARRLAVLVEHVVDILVVPQIFRIGVAIARRKDVLVKIIYQDLRAVTAAPIIAHLDLDDAMLCKRQPELEPIYRMNENSV